MRRGTVLLSLPNEPVRAARVAGFTVTIPPATPAASLDSKLQPSSEHPLSLSDPDFDALFNQNKRIIFAFHGYLADTPAG